VLAASWVQVAAGAIAILGCAISAGAGNAHSLKVDHVTICGADLTALQDAFAGLGLIADYGGPHANGGTHMAVIGLDDGSYIELVAPLKAGSATDSGWSKLMLANTGACAWAVGSADIQRDVDALKNSGLSVDGPFPGGRKKPDGKVLQWQTAALGTQQAGAMLPFMIQDTTPRDWRVKPSASAAHMGFGGVAAVVLGVKDMDAAIALFQKAYGWPAPAREDDPEFGAKLAYFPGSPVMLATPLQSDNWLSKRLRELGDCPVAFLLDGPDFSKASTKAIPAPRAWFGRKVAWLDAERLQGARVGVIAAP
jgi:catechol 2,3-dioxygenase-like lactoylglutathione lyase family enzyme